MGKTTVDIKDKKKIYVDEKGNTYDQYTDFSNKRMARPTGSVEGDEKETVRPEEAQVVRVTPKTTYIKI